MSSGLFGFDIDSAEHGWVGLVPGLTGAVFVLAALALVLFLLHARRRGALASRGATLEIWWTVLPTLVFVGLVAGATRSWLDSAPRTASARALVSSAGPR